MTTCHEHAVGHGDHADAECCICSDNPCGSVTVSMAIAHGQESLQREQASYEQQIAYVLEHGHREPVPF